MLEDPPFDLLCPGRRPLGIAPVLLPAAEDATPDWDGFAHLLGRIVDAGLVPGVNLGPGAVEVLDPSTRAEVVATAGAGLRGRPFYSGVRAEPGADGAFDPTRLAGMVDAVARQGGTPILVPSPTLATLGPDEFVGLLAWMGDWCQQFLVIDSAGDRWAGGRTWGMDVFGAILDLDSCGGVLHASGSRRDEWERIRSRDDNRPDFQVFSSNDGAIDQIMFGADHALDLSAAAPDLVAQRDIAWATEDPATLEFQDALQTLATLVFRPPVAEAQHALARVLHLRGWLAHDRVLGDRPRRPATDDDLLLPALQRLGAC